MHFIISNNALNNFFFNINGAQVQETEPRSNNSLTSAVLRLAERFNQLIKLSFIRCMPSNYF